MSIAEELGITLRHTAFSEGAEGMIFRRRCLTARRMTQEILAQGTWAPCLMRSSMSESIFRRRPGLGDSIALNDPAGFRPLPRCVPVMPVFLEGAIIGYVATSAHQVDIGAAPGSQKVHGVTESFQEGLRILPVRLVREGAFDEDIMRIVLGNVRMPDKVRGDLSAQHGANLTAADRLAQLHRDYGTDLIERVHELILDRTETHMRKSLSQVPEGTFSFEDYMDDYGADTDPIKVAVDITFKDGAVTLDFSRSSDQVPAAINSYINYTRAYAVFAVKVFCDAHFPQNAGGMRPINVVARQGNFFNPSFPAPSGGRAILQIRIFDAINGAMAKALPDRAMGAFSHWSNPNIGGIDDRTGRPFVAYDVILGGYGGRIDCDGAEGMSPVMNCSNIPVEVHEANNPIRVQQMTFIPDSGGAGKHRGGCGLRKDIELLNSSATLSLLGDRHKYAPYGLFGGEDGNHGETVLNPHLNAEPLGSKEIRQLKRGDVVSIRLSGAGGYGDPSERDSAAIAADLADGYITER